MRKVERGSHSGQLVVHWHDYATCTVMSRSEAIDIVGQEVLDLHCIRHSTWSTWPSDPSYAVHSTKTAAQDQESKSRLFYFYVYFILAVLDRQQLRWQPADRRLTPQ